MLFEEQINEEEGRTYLAIATNRRTAREGEILFLKGETFQIFERTQDNWVWGCRMKDGVEGWIRASYLKPASKFFNISRNGRTK
jgi:hypothetical protein